MDINSYQPQQSDRLHRPKNSSKQLELHIAQVYSQISLMIREKEDLQIQMPTQVATAIERVNLIKSVLAFLLDQPNQRQQNKYSNSIKNIGSEHDPQGNQNRLGCADCENYQKNLQKLEGQIRNHIRTHQQLKLYQDGLEQKIEEYKKQRKQIDKKYQTLKRKYEQNKATLNGSMQKAMKLEQQNEKLKNQLKHARGSIKIQQSKKQLNRYQSNKQNLCQWRNQNINQKERPSLQKRPESTDRMRVSVNVRSTKGIPISSKIIQEKAKQDKAKLLKNRIGF